MSENRAQIPAQLIGEDVAGDDLRIVVNEKVFRWERRISDEDDDGQHRGFIVRSSIEIVTMSVDPDDSEEVPVAFLVDIWTSGDNSYEFPGLTKKQALWLLDALEPT